MSAVMKWPLVAIHTLSWIAVALAAYFLGGDFRFANCWHIVLFFIPPLGVPFLFTLILSVAYLLTAVVTPWRRGTRAFVVACHGAAITIGLIACILAAGLHPEAQSCL